MTAPLPPGRPAQRGALLILVMGMMLVICLMTAGLWQLCVADATETARSVQSAQAFWAAEAGLHHGYVLLKNDSNYWNGAHSMTGQLASGSYAASVAAAGSNLYTLASTGTAGRATRAVRQTVLFLTNQWPAIFQQYALADFSQDCTVQGTVSGRLYQAATMTVMSGGRVNGTVEVESTNLTVRPGGFCATNTPPPNPPPAWPVLNTAFYEAYLATAAATSPANRAFSTLNLNTCSNNTLYVNGDTTVTNFIWGPGTLAVSSNATVMDGAWVGSNVRILAGASITMSGIAGTNCTFYARTLISLPGGGTVSNSSLLSLGHIRGTGNIDFTGLAYARSNMLVGGSAFFRGAMIASNSVSVTGRLMQDPSQLPSLPAGIQGDTVISNLQWGER